MRSAEQEPCQPRHDPVARPKQLIGMLGWSEASPSPCPLPQWGRGLRKVGEALPSLTRSWVRGCAKPGSQLTLQESVGRFLSPAYFLAAASIIGRTSFWSESIQSEMKFQPLPSHWKTRA